MNVTREQVESYMASAQANHDTRLLLDDAYSMDGMGNLFVLGKFAGVVKKFRYDAEKLEEVTFQSGPKGESKTVYLGDLEVVNPVPAVSGAKEQTPGSGLHETRHLVIQTDEGIVIKDVSFDTLAREAGPQHVGKYPVM